MDLCLHCAEADEVIARLRNQVAVAKTIVAAGVDLMTTKQVGQWRGVRTFLEQETEDYEPFAETPNDPRNRPERSEGPG